MKIKIFSVGDNGTEMIDDGGKRHSRETWAEVYLFNLKWISFEQNSQYRYKVIQI